MFKVTKIVGHKNDAHAYSRRVHDCGIGPTMSLTSLLNDPT